MIYDLVVFTQYTKAYAPRRFLREAKSLSVSAQLLTYRKTINVKKLPKAKFVILREPNPKAQLYKLRDKILWHYLSANTYVLNSSSYLKWSVLDKKTQEMEFKKARIPHISSENFNNLKYPFVAKAILGSHGDHVYKIKNKNDLKNILQKYAKENLLFQEFQKAGFDLRVIVIDFKAIGIMKRTPRKGEFLSNFSQGGTVEKYSGNDINIINKIAVRTAKHFKLNYVGVDLIKGNDGGWKVLEVNRACQFKGFEKAVLVNVARKTILCGLKNPLIKADF